jgi:penicillin-binding protein 2B
MATMEKGNYDGNATYMSGTMELSNYTIKDWNGYGWGEITYDYGYTQSSNIGVANLIKNYLTGDELAAYLKKLGFGEKTGIELQGETAGQIKFKYDIEVANASFGQGIMTTPIQHIKALTAISNNGYILNPTIVEKIVDPNTNEIVYEAKKQKGTKVASESTVNHIKELMNRVVNADGTGTDFHLDGYDIIGKTGTAEVYNDSTGDYYSSYVHSIRSFAGMYPKDNPKYVFYIAFKDIPSSLPMSNAVKSLIQDLEAYYNLTNVKANTKTYRTVDNYFNKSVDEVKNVLNVNGISYEVIGDGNKIINRYPSQGSLVNGKILLMTNGNFTENNLTGLSSKEVNHYCKMINIPCNVKGTGYVTSYSYQKNESGVVSLNINLEQKYKDVIGEIKTE